MIRRLAVAGIALVSIAGFAACSSDGEQVSDEIAEQIKSNYGLAEEPDTSCPDDAKAEEGQTFACTSDIDGVEVTMGVEFTSDTSFTITPIGLYTDDELVPSVIAEAAAQDVVIVELDCPGDGYVVIEPGATIDCTGTDDLGQPGTAVIELSEDGELSLAELIPG
jgi:hypothetical protein